VQYSLNLRQIGSHGDDDKKIPLEKEHGEQALQLIERSG